MPTDTFEMIIKLYDHFYKKRSYVSYNLDIKARFASENTIFQQLMLGKSMNFYLYPYS
jgi:hypothetical protein